MKEKKSRRITIRRISAKLTVAATSFSPEIVHQVGVVLNDLSLRGVGLYVPQLMVAGQHLTLEIAEPKPLTLKGKVIWCNEYNAGSHILTGNRLPYRAGIQFEFETPEQEAALKQFYDELYRLYLGLTPTVAA